MHPAGYRTDSQPCALKDTRPLLAWHAMAKTRTSCDPLQLSPDPRVSAGQILPPEELKGQH